MNQTISGRLGAVLFWEIANLRRVRGVREMFCKTHHVTGACLPATRGQGDGP